MSHRSHESSQHAGQSRTDLLSRCLQPVQGPWQSWNRWWFEPASTVPIALFRILYGALLLLFVALLVPDVQVFFGQGGPFTPEDAARFWGNVPDYSVLLWFPAPTAVALFFAVFTAAVICLTIGLWTRLSAILVFIGLVSIGHRNPLILHGGDTLLRLIAFYLILAPAGAALSIDRLRAVARCAGGPRPPLAPPWAQRLLQLQVAFVYAMTVLLKLKGGAWVDGTALYYTSRLEEFRRFPMPFVPDSMLLVNLLTYWTLATELSLAFLIWAPGLRRFVLLNGLLLHAGIEYSMNVPLFAFAMVISYVTFVDVEAAWTRILALTPMRNLSRATLWVPRTCPTCAAVARVLLALDLFHRLQPAAIPIAGSPNRSGDAGLDEVRVDPADGRTRTGLAALRWLSWRLPLLWIVAPLLYIPGSARLFDLAMRRTHGVSHPQPDAAGSPAIEPTPLTLIDDHRQARQSHLRVADPSPDRIDSGPESEAVAAFLQQRCIVKTSAITSAESLFNAYASWARDHDQAVLSQRDFGIALTEHGLARRRHGKANRWHWAGVQLASSPLILPQQSRANPGEPGGSSALASSAHDPSTARADSSGFAAAGQAGG